MEKIEKKIDFQIWIEIYHENLKWKNWNFHFVNLKIFIFEIWNAKLCLFLFFCKIGHITKWKWKSNWNEEITYFVYAAEIKLPIIPLYHPYHLCIPPYTTCASCGGIQLISAVGSFHMILFQQWYRVVWSTVKKTQLINLACVVSFTCTGMGWTWRANAEYGSSAAASTLTAVHDNHYFQRQD
jgi:hypothetical protein